MVPRPDSSGFNFDGSCKMLPFRWLLGVLVCLLLDFFLFTFSGLGLDRSICCLPVLALCDTVVECNVTLFSLESKMLVRTTFLFSFKKPVFRNMIIWLRNERKLGKPPIGGFMETDFSSCLCVLVPVVRCALLIRCDSKPN